MLPLSLGCYLFYRAMLARRQDDAATAATLFGLAEEVLEAALSLDAVWAQEAATLLWRAVFERGAAHLVLGQPGAALAAFEAIPRQPEEVAGPRRLAQIGADLPARIALQRALALCQLGRSAEAADGLRRLLDEPAITTPAQRQEARQMLADTQASPPGGGRTVLARRLRRGAGWTLRRLGLR